ncbi:MAG: hypothetical protein K2I81_02810 [Alphaproteobacteria bacterium]|nr:hypothetical protein [Alphaproteobacteria bacterium]
MKLKILIVILALAGNICIYDAYALGVTCLDCTDSRGNCTSYAASCCAPCGSGSGGGCTDCNSTAWASTGTAGHESRTEAFCVLGNCSKAKTYRCAAEYYGKTLNGTSGCTKCPSPGTSTAGENEDITSCYIPSGNKFSDSTGSGTYTGNCYYTN